MSLDSRHVSLDSRLGTLDSRLSTITQTPFRHLLQKGGYLPFMLFKVCLSINGFQSDCALPSAE